MFATRVEKKETNPTQRKGGKEMDQGDYPLQYAGKEALGGCRTGHR